MKLLTWLDERIDDAVKRRFASIDSLLEANTQKALNDVVEMERRISAHLATLEDNIIALLHRCDKDCLLDHERDALIRAAFRRAS